MIWVHGIEATLVVGAVTVTGHLESATHDLPTEVAEIRVIGETDVIRVAGLNDSNLTADGPWDATIIAGLFAARAARTPVSVVFSPDGGTNTFTTDMIITNLQQRVASNDAARWSVSLAGSGECAIGP